jgi:hypothetical protein
MTSTRPVGAPKGNHNALKHGFYSTRFSASGQPPSRALASGPSDEPNTLDLSDEITLLRLSIARVVNLTPPEETLDSARETLRLLCLASTAISRLVRAQYLIHGQEGETISEYIGRIAEEVRHEMAGDVPPGYYDDDDEDEEESPDPIPGFDPASDLSSPAQTEPGSNESESAPVSNPLAYPLKEGVLPNTPHSSTYLSVPEPEPLPPTQSDPWTPFVLPDPGPGLPRYALTNPPRSRHKPRKNAWYANDPIEDMDRCLEPD